MILQTTESSRQKKTYLTGKMAKGISSIQVENTHKKLDDEDINDNFVGVFPANHMNRFIDYKTMILEK